ncbi:hypothetical protein AAON49_07590 [Pseudotenacibaculum sp. MALMAid0570]|uniref:hypothetical protein n=1 Tax=Pseudotenacibaculum sp. MALMAid0570 TaxID=3143938 RepID=UPI0032DFD0DD
MSAESLYDNIQSYLRLASRITSREGDNINVGERFTIRFTGSNSAYATNLVGKPNIIFNNTRVYVQGTEFARPVGGNGWHNLSDTALRPGESSFIDVEFEAIDDLDFWSDIFGVEHVAKAWILADLDQNEFFKIWDYKDVHEEIIET